MNIKQFRTSIAIKSLGSLIILLAAVALIFSTAGYRTFSQMILDQYADGGFRTAESAAQMVDADHLDKLLASGGASREYQVEHYRLQQLCNSQNVTFIYVIQPDLTDYAHITFVFSTINDDSPYTQYETGYVRETTNNEYRRKYKALYDGESDRELVIRDKGYIETDAHITTMIPLKGSDGEVTGIMCVQRQMEALIDLRHRFLRRTLLIFIAVGVIAALGTIFYMHRKLLKPLRRITQEASRFARENIAAERKLADEIRTRDEIGILAESVDRMEEQVQEYVANLTRITAESERINTELDLGARIQASMLPGNYPAFPERTEFDIFASMTPAKEVGGDFYDFFLIDGEHLGLVMADVSGKGVPAALFMMASRILLQNAAMSGLGPAEILETVNNKICRNNKAEMFVTIWLGILDLKTGNLTAANAGHEYPIIRKSHGDFEIYKDKHGFVVGGMEGMKYQDYVLQMEPGSKIFLYTDGVTEATNAEEELFGLERIVGALNEKADGTPGELLGLIERAVKDFVRGAPQFDDLTMMCVEYRGPEGPADHQ